MSIKGWQYYNHAAIPTTAPHEKVNLEPIKDKTIWNMEGKPLLVRWASEWDCEEESNWWYIICDAPYEREKLSKKSRKNIRKSIENCEVKKIKPLDCANDLWRVFQEAVARYTNYSISIDEETFKNQIVNKKNNEEYWAGYDRVTGQMIGYKICTVYDEWVECTVSKYSSDYLNLRVSDALNDVVLDYYLNICGKKYVSNGSRSVVHDTNVQDYYQEHFKFRKAYCKVNIIYRRGFGLLVKLVYPFRKYITNNKISGLLLMEEYSRN